jgi:hypothetical protein
MSETANNNSVKYTQNRMIPTSSLFQENRGKRWSQEEDTYLLNQIQFLSHSDIGKYLKRSENAVLSRLKKLAFHMIQNGEDIATVQNNLKLSNEDLNQINNEFFVYARKPPSQSKFILTSKKPIKKGYFIPPQSPELQLLYEIRSMLRKILYKDNNNEYKSPKREVLRENASPNSSFYSLPLISKENQGYRFYELNIEELEKRSDEFAKSNNCE